MAENLDDGEFWLPSQFLTDDDILEDFKSEGFLSTETETSDDDDMLLPGFCNKANLPSTGSPQSTLYGWEYTTRQSSSQGSPSPQKETRAEAENEDKNTLDLLNKAAGEVAKMKMKSEKSSGTGFFDCSNSGKGLLRPPVKTQPLPQRPLPVFQPPFYSYPYFRFPLHMMYGPVQLPPPQQPRQIQNKATKNTNNKTNSNTNNISNDRPLGLPPSAWPPLPGQAQTQTQTQPQSKTQPQPQPQSQPLQTQAQPLMGMYAVPQGMSVGTGVFLPRVVPATSDSKKKSDVNVMKTKNNKVSQKRNARLTKANDVEEIKLPSEWVY